MRAGPLAADIGIHHGYQLSLGVIGQPVRLIPGIDESLKKY